jgi:uncharacterized protein YndB with AHSA1/START domain
LDLRPGGIFLASQRSPEGQDMWGKFVYQEIKAPEKLVFIQSFSDEKGNTVRAPFSPVWPLEIINKLTFTESEGTTTLTLIRLLIDRLTNAEISRAIPFSDGSCTATHE